VTPEGKVKSWVKKALKELHEEDGYFVYSFWPVQTGMGASTLDALTCINGHFVAIETKAKGKTMTDRQRTVAQDMCWARGLVFVVDSKESLDRVMQSIRKQCHIKL
jgi:hypothetical protein